MRMCMESICCTANVKAVHCVVTKIIKAQNILPGGSGALEGAEPSPRKGE